MSTSIEWTQETWNPLAGCSMCSPGCANCYAEKMAKRQAGMARADLAAGRDPGRKRHYLNVINDKGRWNGNLALIEEALTDPIRRKKPTTWFVNSMSDLFHEAVPFEFVDKVFAVMALTPHHTYQILTKRPERMAEYFGQLSTEHRIGEVAFVIAEANGIDWDVYWRKRDFGYPGEPPRWPLKNVWLGTSVEDQKRADERIPHLLKCPAAVRFLSVEPMLGEINLRAINVMDGCDLGDVIDSVGGTKNHLGYDFPYRWVDWVIVGGESGPGARPFNLEWARSIVGQCKAAGVACFVKQLGSNPVGQEGVDVITTEDAPDRISVVYKGVRPPTYADDFERRHEIRFHDTKGGNMSEWPEDLRVRELPEVGRA